jgi:hypothetical protein
MCDAADQCQRSGPWSGLTVRNDFLDKSFIFGGFSVVQWRTLHDLPGGEPHEGLRAKKPSGQVEVDFIRQAISKNFMQVLRNVCSRGMVRVMIWVPVVWRGGDGERKWKYNTFG